MIVSSIINSLVTVIKALFSWINIPSAGEEIQNAFGYFGSLLTVGQSLIDLFLPWNLVKFGLPLIIAVMNFEYIYKFIMWILKKIPMLGIE